MSLGFYLQISTLLIGFYLVRLGVQGLRDLPTRSQRDFDESVALRVMGYRLVIAIAAALPLLTFVTVNYVLPARGTDLGAVDLF